MLVFILLVMILFNINSHGHKLSSIININILSNIKCMKHYRVMGDKANEKAVGVSGGKV